MPKTRPSRDTFTPRHADVGHAPTREPDFETLQRIEAHDRQMHVERALEAGLSREEAERHADEHHGEWSPRDVQEREEASGGK